MPSIPHRSRPAARIALAALVAALLGAGLPAAADAAAVREFSAPAAPRGITAGPDGNLWFTEPAAGRIGRITPEGAAVDFPAGGSSQSGPAPSQPSRIVTGPDGELWFSDALGGLGNARTDGSVSRLSLVSGGATEGIASGPDGRIWYTKPGANLVGRIDTNFEGNVEFPLDGDRRPGDLVAGPDGALWFVEPASNSIGRITTAGQVSHYPIPTANADPRAITVGPDGQLWFTERAARKIARIAGDGQITELPLPGTTTQPGEIVAGPDGALWFTELAAGRNSIGRMTVQGAASRYPLPGSGISPDITRRPDGTLWYTRGAAAIGRVTPLPAPPAGAQVSLEPMEQTTVRVKPPSARSWSTLPADGANLPVGTEIDTRQSHVRVTAAIGTGSPLTKTADFHDGRFKVVQPATADAPVDLVLTGQLANCTPKRRASRRATGRTAGGGFALPERLAGALRPVAAEATAGVRIAATRPAAVPRAAAKKPPKRKGRRLWGNGKGKFRTRGKRAAASVRGTNWLVEDTCGKSTLVRVREGTVEVRDFERNRTVIVGAGQRYVAKIRR
ncbi:virginiamycin B lyase family protein [Patulibacter defluvii]|uniref:virginiamycin B lyase family protein n=1 Tax=Patulibacter defluvii TaxID=3095358 RepID=UPI002A76368C|nr:hypothetical protein [Patulibacter sp. DM4]